MKPPILYYFETQSVSESLAFRFEKSQRRTVSRGPGGLSGGLLITPFVKCDAPEFSDSEYSWQKMKGVHLGVRNGVQPSDFLRESHVEGHFVELGDGCQWLVPVALLNTPNFSLPQYETLDDGGAWIWKVQDKYSHLAHIAEKFWLADGKDGLEESFIRNACCASLSVNYDLIDIEIAALKLLTHSAYLNIISALIDKPGLAELGKISLRHVRRKLWKQGLNPDYEPTFADATLEAQEG